MLNKKFFTIAQTAEILGEEVSTLRYWEKEFRQLSPRKSAGGTRHYTETDLTLLKTIKHLLRDQKLTIAGARQRLNVKKSQSEKSQIIYEKLQNIHKELLALRREFNDL